MPPELKILGLVIAVHALAYLIIYPRMQPKSLRRMMRIDLVISAAVLALVGSVYFGSGTGFTLLIFSTSWWVFTLLVSAVIEVPLFMWFCNKWGLNLNGDDDMSS